MNNHRLEEEKEKLVSTINEYSIPKMNSERKLEEEIRRYLSLCQHTVE